MEERVEDWKPDQETKMCLRLGKTICTACWGEMMRSKLVMGLVLPYFFSSGRISGTSSALK